jgi:hypothetical protein
VTEEAHPAASDHSNEGFADRELDRVVEEHPGFTDAIDNLMIPGFDEKLNAVLSDMDTEAADDKAMLAEFEKLPDAEAAGVSVKPVSDADKTFNDHEVVSVARDCCLILQRARWSEQPELGAAELSPQLEEQLRQAINTDIATHHHHVTPGLEIDDARITSAVLVDGKEVVTVRLSLRGEQMVRDDRTDAIIEGSENETKWQEDWTLVRDPRQADTAGADTALTSSGQWFVAHQGWIVTKIQPVDGSPSETPPLLS